MANYDSTSIPSLKHLQRLGQRQVVINNELTGRVKALEDVGSQANVLESVKVNGTAQPIAADKSVDIHVPTKVSELTNDKTYQTRDEVAASIAAVDHLKRKKVTSTADIDVAAADADQYIYMVPKNGHEGDADKYDEYMVLDGVLEKVGDWYVDLSGYVPKETGKGLSDNNFTDAYKNKIDNLGGVANLNVATDEEVNAMLDEVFGVQG